jgi:hypothetical protein
VNRNFNFSVNMHTSPGLPALDPQTAASLALIRNLQPAMVQPMLQNAIESGWLPVASENADSGTTFGWITFSPRTPSVETCTVRMTKDHQLASVECPLFSLRELKYGAAGAFKLTPPAWPEMPVVEHETFEASVLFRMMAALSRVFIDDAPSATQAAQAAVPARQ